MPTAEQVRAVLRTAWHRLADECTPPPGGITAANWSVTIAGHLYTVKIVPSTSGGGVTHSGRHTTACPDSGTRAWRSFIRYARTPPVSRWSTEPAKGLPG